MKQPEPKPQNQIDGELLRLYLRRRGFTQEALARKLRLTPGRISQFLKSGKIPIHHQAAILSIVKITPSEIALKVQP